MGIIGNRMKKEYREDEREVNEDIERREREMRERTERERRERE
jgi:hypothetical protein